MYINNYKEKDGWNWAWLDQRHSWVKSLFKDATMTSWLSIDSNYGWWFCFSSGISWTIFFFYLFLQVLNTSKSGNVFVVYFPCKIGTIIYFLLCFHAPLLYGFAIFSFKTWEQFFFLSLSWIRLRMWLALTNVEVTLYQFWSLALKGAFIFLLEPYSSILECGIERSHLRLFQKNQSQIPASRPPSE